MIKSNNLRVGPETLYFVRTSRIYHSIKYFANHSPKRLSAPSERRGIHAYGIARRYRHHRIHRRRIEQLRLRKRYGQRTPGPYGYESNLDNPPCENRRGQRKDLVNVRMLLIRHRDRGKSPYGKHRFLFRYLSRRNGMHVRQRFERPLPHLRRRRFVLRSGNNRIRQIRLSGLPNRERLRLRRKRKHFRESGGNPRGMIEPQGIPPQLRERHELRRLCRERGRKAQNQRRVQTGVRNQEEGTEQGRMGGPQNGKR